MKKAFTVIMLLLALFFNNSLIYAKKKVVENGVTYTIYKDYAKIAKPKKGPNYEGTISIPAYIMDGKYPVSGVESECFTANSKITGFHVDANNPTLCLIDGMLYDKVSKTIIKCPNGVRGMVRIADDVENIGEWAFYGCEHLDTLIIGKNLKRIGDNAFAHCKHLDMHMNLPEGLEYIGEHAFKGCISIRSIYIPQTVLHIGGAAFYNCYLNPLIIAKSNEKMWKREIEILHGIEHFSVIYCDEYLEKRLSGWWKERYCAQIYNISEYHGVKEGIIIEEVFDMALNTSDNDFETKRELYLTVASEDRLNKSGYQTMAYYNLGALYEERGDVYEARTFYRRSEESDPSNQDAVNSAERMSAIIDARNKEAKQQRREETMALLTDLVQSIDNIQKAKGSHGNNSATSQGTYSSGSSSSSSGKGRTQVTCRFCNGTGRLAGRTYTGGSSGNKEYCKYCDKIDYTHVHKHCSYCKGTGHVSQ